MNSPKQEKILLLVDLHSNYSASARQLLQRFNDAQLTILLEDWAGPETLKLFQGREIIHARGPASSPGAFWSLLRSLRSRRFDRVFVIGSQRDLRYLTAAWFAAAPICCFIEVRPGWDISERNLRILNLFIPVLWRLILWILFLPALVSLKFTLSGGRKKGKTSSVSSSSPFPPHPPVSVVIPNYNGRSLLQEYLPSIVKAVSYYGNGSEIILVDDASTDGSLEYLNVNFPSVKVLPLKKNAGFGRASHLGIQKAAHDLIALLNSDIEAEEDFLGPLVECFQDRDVFAVQPRALSIDRKTLNFGLNVGHLEGGYIRIWNEADTRETKRVDRLFPTLYCLGGAMLMDRRKYRLLGGFDELFYPFRWEDIDLCYRAAKRGWKVLYQPASQVYHCHHATLKKVFSADYLNIIEQKNELLFAWKNLHDPRLIREHYRGLPIYLFVRLLSGNYNFARGLLRALFSLPLCLKRRRQEQAASCRKDRLVLNRSLHLYHNFLRGDRDLGEGRKRQILVLNPVFPYPPIDGGKARVYNLLREASRTNDIHLLCYIDPNQKEYLPEMRKFCASVNTVDFPPPFGCLGPLREALFPMYYRGYYSEAMGEKLREILRTRPIDIVQMESDKMLYYVNFVEDLPTVYIEQDVANICLRAGKNPPQKGWKKIVDLLEWMRALRWEVVMGRKYSRIVALSPQDAEIVKSLLPKEDIRYVKHGTNVRQFYGEYREVKSKSLLYVGSFVHYPNVEAIRYFCREIWPRVKKEIPEAMLTVVGSHPNEEILQLSRLEGVEVTGFVPSVRPYLDRSAVFIAPMRKGLGMKGKILEAMARAKPVVTTSIGIRGAEVVPGRHLLVGDSPSDFARAVILLLRDEQLREKIARAGQELVKNEYDWSRAAEEMDIIYAEILS